MIHDPYYVTPRKPLSDKKRLQLLIAHKGRCCICGQKIDGVHEQWDDFDVDDLEQRIADGLIEAFIDEHGEPLWRQGSNDFKNRGPAHVKCAVQKTRKEASERAKGRRVAQGHFGAKRAKTKALPHGRRSRTKKRMDGTVVNRVTGRPVGGR